MNIVHIDHFGDRSLSDMNYFCMHRPVAVVAHRAQTAHLFPGRYAILPGACCWRIVTIMPKFFVGPATAARLIMRSVFTGGTLPRHRRQAPIPRRVDGWRAEEPRLQ